MGTHEGGRRRWLLSCARTRGRRLREQEDVDCRRDPERRVGWSDAALPAARRETHDVGVVAEADVDVVAPPDRELAPPAARGGLQGSMAPRGSPSRVVNVAVNEVSAAKSSRDSRARTARSARDSAVERVRAMRRREVGAHDDLARRGGAPHKRRQDRLGGRVRVLVARPLRSAPQPAAAAKARTTSSRTGPTRHRKIVNTIFSRLGNASYKALRQGNELMMGLIAETFCALAGRRDRQPWRSGSFRDGGARSCRRRRRSTTTSRSCRLQPSTRVRAATSIAPPSSGGETG